MGEVTAKHRMMVAGGIVFALIVAVTLLAPWVSPYDPVRQSVTKRLEVPSAHHWLGTDHFGRDILSRILHGGRTTLLSSILSVMAALGAGALLGTVGAYCGGWLESITMRLMDVLLSFPLVLLAILLATALGPGLFNLVVALGISQIPIFARLSRALTLSVRHLDWISASISLGALDSRILLRHIVPNISVPLLVQATSSIALAILYASALNFLGLGVRPPTPDWGAMISEASSYVFDRPYLPLFPGVAITLSVVSLNIFADSLVETLDPTSRKVLG